ncbi:hypothetical protein PI124_g12086 [Phytophthora idaei]|nr:hypothetical protein PI125_g11667 [Phytophthora idaei]KAG3152138.1 hypothetical protein PI126_g10640 [Phytophthora idaei]KAG3243072.1 hypothetical protein PI124_g12086 [Phytophthora idaei]
MSEHMEADNTFTNYPHALYATEVKFQTAYRPGGRFTKQKVYFSAKHKLYGFKIERSVAPPGVAVDVSDHSPGSTSDLAMMLDRLSIHHQMLRKEDGSTPEIGGEPTHFPQMWAALVDKGYQAAGRVLRTIQQRSSRGAAPSTATTLPAIEPLRQIEFSSMTFSVECACFGKQPTLPSSGTRIDSIVSLGFVQLLQTFT